MRDHPLVTQAFLLRQFLSPTAEITVACGKRGTGNDCSKDLLMEAARGLLDQHRIFSEEKLSTYVSICYPEVPAEQRRPLVLGAVVGAQLAANMQIVFERNRSSPDLRKREMATNAGSALSYWSMGLRASPRILPLAQPTVSSDTAQTSDEHAVTALNNAVVPVPMNVACSDFDVVQQTAQETVILLPTATDATTEPASTASVPEARNTANTEEAEPYQPVATATGAAQDVNYTPTLLNQLVSVREPDGVLKLEIREGDGKDFMSEPPSAKENIMD